MAGVWRNAQIDVSFREANGNSAIRLTAPDMSFVPPNP
jgi:hypothetical protein